MSSTRLAMLLVGTALAVGAVIADIVIGAWHCTSETSNCVSGGADVRWQGRLFDAEGHSAAGVPISLDFNSVGGRPHVRTRTDGRGQFCVRWPRERVPAHLLAGPVLASGRVDPRFANSDARDPAANDPTLEPGASPPVAARAVLLTPNRYLWSVPGVFVNYRDWRGDLDARHRCASASAPPPWYRREDAFGNWRSILALMIGIVAAALGLIGLAARRRRLGSQLAPVTLLLGSAAVAAYAVVWGHLLS